MIATIQCATPQTQSQRRSQGLSPRPQWLRNGSQQYNRPNTPPPSANRQQQPYNNRKNTPRQPSPYPPYSPGGGNNNGPSQDRRSSSPAPPPQQQCPACGRNNCTNPQHRRRSGCWICGRYGCHSRNHEDRGSNQNTDVKTPAITPPPNSQGNRDRNSQMGDR